MLLAVYLVIILIGLFVKQSPKKFDLIAIAFMSIIVCVRTDVADFAAYQTVYQHIQAGNVYMDTGAGWYLICLLLGKLGLSYAVVKMVLFFATSLLIRHTVNFFVHNYKQRTFLWSLFLIFPALLDGVQIRFFVAEGLIIFSLPYLLTEKRMDKWKFVLITLIAISVHSSAAFYLIFLLAPITKHIRKVIFLLAVLLSGVMLVNKRMIFLLASKFINANRIERYFLSSNGVGTFGIIAYTATILIFIVLMRKAAIWSKGAALKPETRRLLQLFEQLSALAMLILPLTTFDTNFFRIQRPFWLVLYLEAAILMENHCESICWIKKKIKVKHLYIGMAVVANITYICVFNFNVIRDFLM